MKIFPEIRLEAGVMAVVESIPGTSNEPGCDDAAETGVCFFCGVPLGAPFVHWHGFYAHISVHVECAKALAVHLCHDALHAERIAAGRHPLAGVQRKYLGGGE